MKKLLLLGDNVHTDGLVKAARQRGIYTIVTDNKTTLESPSKLLADEYWDISVTDIDALEKKAVEDGIDAVLCGASEVCQEAVRLLCKRLDLPFWVGDKAWEYTNDKSRFKQLCKECGLPVAKEYKLDISFRDEDLAAIEYPVVVKPVDCCSSIGMHVCYNKEELILGYRDAYECSEKKKVLVEQFFSGMEIGLIYLFYEEGPCYLASFDSFGDRKNGHPMIFGAEPTVCPVKLEKTLEASLKRLFSELECKKGTGFVQILYDGKQAAVMEMNYRLAGTHFFDERLMHEHMLDCAFSIPATLDERLLRVDHQTYIYFIWLKPGKIKNVYGLDRIKEKDFYLAMNPAKEPGDIVEDNSGMRQLLTGIVLKATEADISEIVDQINNTIKVKGEDGSDMVYRYRYDEVKPSFI